MVNKSPKAKLMSSNEHAKHNNVVKYKKKKQVSNFTQPDKSENSVISTSQNTNGVKSLRIKDKKDIPLAQTTGVLEQPKIRKTNFNKTTNLKNIHKLNEKRSPGRTQNLPFDNTSRQLSQGRRDSFSRAESSL